MKIWSTILVLVTMFPALLFAQPGNQAVATSGDMSGRKVPVELQSRISDFFKLIIKDEPEDAFNNLLKGSPIVSKKDEVKNLLEQTRRAQRLYGPMRGYESVTSEFATESLVRLKYLGLHPKYPMRWIFTFYKSPDYGWIVINVKFDDMSEYLFMEG